MIICSAQQHKQLYPSSQAFFHTECIHWQDPWTESLEEFEEVCNLPCVSRLLDCVTDL
jgi:hypothetical protein